MSNAVVTIGNTTPDAFADWIDETYDPAPGMMIVPTVGYWNGVREQSIMVTLFDLTPHFAVRLLAQYGEDHPEEEAFGLLESTFSKLITNESHQSFPDTLPEDWS